MNSLILLLPAVPRDLELPLPLSTATLEFILVALFLLHILFVNLMVGGSLLTVLFELIGLSRPRYDTLARRIGETITVNKSLAVVLGVGPLLAINLLYTTYFYSANALTGYAWISVIPMVIIAFLLTYIHKYTWDRWIGPLKRHHIAQGIGAAVLFLFIPLIFLANINLMLFPARWTEVRGFFGALQIGNVFPRYFHFITASLAIVALFLAGWLGRKKYPVETRLPEFTRPELRRLFFSIAFYATLVQILLGPFLLFTLPSHGVTSTLLWIVGGGITLAAILLLMLWRESTAHDRRVGRYYAAIVTIFSILVVFMATGRHVYREACVDSHRQLVTDRTAQFKSIELAAQMRLDAGLTIGDALASGATGKGLFPVCAGCHAVDRVLAAPALTEIYSIYAGNPQGIVNWAKNPGDKRAQFPPMPSFAHLGDQKLELVAEYMLELGGGEAADSATTESAM